MKARELALGGLSIALVYVVTRVFVLPIPQTKGFFNLGEGAIYAVALLLGPRTGALAGGLGSALADLTLGYQQYAPYTLLIKGAEGWLVGHLAAGGSPRAWAWGLAAGAGASAWLFVAEGWATTLAAAVLLAAALGGLGFLFSGRLMAGGPAARMAGMVTGGMVMVAGYFATQAYLFRLGAGVALAEVPYNLVQVAVGVVVGLAVSASVAHAIPALRR